MDDEALIQYKNVEIHQQELCVLSDVNLELHKGEFVYLIGKVGSGKTSLLKTLYGELDIIDGEAEVLGYDMRSIKRKHIPQLRRKLGIVFQDFQLLTDRTVYNNLEFVLRATGWKNKQEIQDRIEGISESILNSCHKSLPPTIIFILFPIPLIQISYCNLHVFYPIIQSFYRIIPQIVIIQIRIIFKHRRISTETTVRFFAETLNPSI